MGLAHRPLVPSHNSCGFESPTETKDKFDETNSIFTGKKILPKQCYLSSAQYHEELVNAGL
jgi:hypothetical protein